jgi:hypothetical protein
MTTHLTTNSLARRTILAEAKREGIDPTRFKRKVGTDWEALVEAIEAKKADTNE